MRDRDLSLKRGAVALVCDHRPPTTDHRPPPTPRSTCRWRRIPTDFIRLLLPMLDEAKPEDAAAKDAEQSITDLIKSDYDVLVTLADQQQDPNSPLYSVKAFEDLGLHEDLLKGIYDMKFTKPSKIQERALPLLLKDPTSSVNLNPERARPPPSSSPCSPASTFPSKSPKPYVSHPPANSPVRS
ncbi:hypothetical protein PENSPDRAFT_441763 [Peniophora sp. CONT]|nr:hypothetical protein PENSPDRAFT_441763 [Peniophora sp. CONT]